MVSPVPIVELKQATKTFGGTVAVDDLSIAIGPGQVFGLIGPSGCGKTTTIRLLLGVLTPSSESVCVMGTEPARFGTRQRERMGYAPQAFLLYPTLTVYENVRFVAGLFGMAWPRRRRRIREALEFLELWDARKRLTSRLSGGMKRRLALACALVHKPELLFVDEPTAGLDPLLRGKIWELLRTLRDRGVTIFVSTQFIDEIEHCDNVALIVGLLNVPVFGPAAALAAALLLLVAASVGIGLVVSMLSSSEQQAAQLAMLILIASVFFSGFLVALDTIRWPIRIVSYLLPATYAIRTLDDVMLRGVLNTPFDLGILGAFGLLFFAASLLLFRREFKAR